VPPVSALVCFPLEEEAVPFRRLAAARPGVQIILTGIGQENSRRRVTEAIACCRPELVLTCGFAGGLSPELALGTVLFHVEADAVLAPNRPLLSQILRTAGAQPARFYCAPRIAVTVAEKQVLRAETHADAVEMESEAIHTLCRERGIACATVRVISDTASEDMPLDFNQLSRPDLSLDYAKLAWAIVRAPGKIGALLRLRRHCRMAAQRLAEVLERVLAAR
jgi:adenosylhomocysteine nucleosidase